MQLLEGRITSGAAREATRILERISRRDLYTRIEDFRVSKDTLDAMRQTLGDKAHGSLLFDFVRIGYPEHPIRLVTYYRRDRRNRLSTINGCELSRSFPAHPEDCFLRVYSTEERRERRVHEGGYGKNINLKI